MKELVSHITIGDKSFSFLNEVTITSGFKQLTDTAMIKQIRSIKFKDQNLKDLIKRGDAVTIKLGYNDQLNTEFQGYVTRIDPKVPFEIHCEDDMWQLKQVPINMSWESVTLTQLLADIIPSNYTVVAPEQEIGKFQIKKATAAQVLEKLKGEYGIYSYFKNGVLYVANPHLEGLPTVKYHFQRNVPDSNKSLQFRTKEDSRIKVTAIGIQPDNTKIEVVVGDQEGEDRTLTYFNVSEEALKIRANEELDRLKVDGYRGSINAFGEPYVEHGYKATIIDDNFPEREGTYFIDKVTTKFGINGFRRTNEIGSKVTA